MQQALTCSPRASAEFQRQALVLAHLAREAAAAPPSEAASWIATLARHAQRTLEAARPGGAA